MKNTVFIKLISRFTDNIVLIYDRELSTNEIIEVETYFQTIYGIDNVNMFDINNHDGVHDISLPENATFICDDAYNSVVLEKHFSNIKFDVIIDDGPHTKESQLFTLNFFHNKMRKNVVIFIEDVGSWEPHESVCKYIYENFEGDKNCLSLIDRTRNPFHGWNEYILMYYIE